MPTVAAPSPPEPRQLRSSLDRGVRARRNPAKALEHVSGAEVDMDNLHWSRVAKCLPNTSLDLVLGREIDLLEELGGD